MPYRGGEYYMSAQTPSHITNIASSSIPRHFSDNQSRTDMYHSETNFYGGSRKTYDSREALPSSIMYNQSYDRRHPSPPDFHLSTPSSSYREHHYTDRNTPVSSLHQMKRPDLPPMLDDFSLAPSHTGGFNSDVERAAMSGAHSERSADSDFWPTHPSPNHHSPSLNPIIPQGNVIDPPKPKKPRREKPRIELAPDQPPTTQGKPRARVYVACIQCRTRKIRCDGAKPACHNCQRRTTGCNDCTYDAVPKRRGPDKCPGARQRMARGDADGTRRRRRTTNPTVPTRETSSSTEPDTIPHNRHEVDNCQPLTLVSTDSTGSDHSICSPNNDFAHVHNTYVRQYSPECRCHGLVHCPDLMGHSAHNDSSRKPSAPSPTFNDTLEQIHSIFQSQRTASGSGQPMEIDVDQREEYLRRDSHSSTSTLSISDAPSVNFSRKVWWDSLLSFYASPFHSRALTTSERELTSHKIGTDLRWIFRASNYWFSFFHIPSFFARFYDVQSRERMQPSLVMALLAISTFFQSSEVGNGREGRARALRFRDEAQGALEASFNSGWVDETLAQAAWLLALFEVCSHPKHSSQRSRSAMLLLDSIIRSLSLTFVDADDPTTTLFPPGTVPVVSSPRIEPQLLENRGLWSPEQPLIQNLNDGFHPNQPQPPSPVHAHSGSGEAPGCTCQSMTLREHWPSAHDHVPMWESTPAWDEDWSESDVRKESIRRLCWSSMTLAAGHISYTMAHRSQALDLFISNPSNYALLFSGESVARSPALSHVYPSKDTIWALYDRAFLLWHGCTRMRKDNSASETEKAHFAVKAWLEADSLEVALNRHTCAIERAFIFQAREYIFNTRMCISYEFQRYIPLVSANVNGLFHRSKAEEWLRHQATVAQRFMLGLHTVTGNVNNLLARRPFFVFWFMGQISHALALWQCDNSLIVALDVCMSLLPAIDYLTALWPCAEQRLRYEALRDKLEQACFTAGIPPPPPPNFNLPAPSTPEALV